MSKPTKKAERQLTRQEAIYKLWELGNLRYLLKGVQNKMYDAVFNTTGKRTIFLCSRRLGKSFCMLLIAVEYCLKNPNAIVTILFPKKKDARSISRDQMKTILDDCPPHLKPEWKEAQNVFSFPNGAEIQMAGTDGGSAESIRGRKCHLALLDECGFHDFNDFQYIVQSIIMPTLLTTKGKMIMASTPSREPDHPFMTNYVAPARADGSLIEYDIHSNPLISEQDIEEIAAEYPLGFEDPDFQREFLLVSNIASELMVIPEFPKLQDEVVKSTEIPPYYDFYVACDPAVSDTTGILFAYYDFLRKKLVFRGEAVLGGPNETSLTTEEIAEAIIRKEKEYFCNRWTGEQYKPFLRVMDWNAPLLMNDLNAKHGIQFIATDKTEKEEKINLFRLMLRRGEIEIHPSCKNLIYQLRNAKWKISSNKNKTFARLKGLPSEEIKPNHCDLVDCAIYIIRNLVQDKDPYPAGYFELSGDNIFRNGNSSKIQEATTSLVNTILNIRKN